MIIKPLTTLLLFSFFSFSPALTFAQTKQNSQTKPLVFVHVTVIDATGSPPKFDMTVILTGDRITSLGKTAKLRIPKGTQIIDGTSKFLIPGLWDMHVHLSITTEPTLPAFIANGVTGVRDMGGDLSQIDGWRKSIASGSIIGPRIVRAGPLVDGPKKTAMYRLTVNNPTEARQAVISLKQQGVDGEEPGTSLSFLHG